MPLDIWKPALDRAGLDVKILLWDHNKERVYENAKTYFEGDSGRNLGNGLSLVQRGSFRESSDGQRGLPGEVPDFYGGLRGVPRFDRNNLQQQAEMYAHDMIGNFNHGCRAHIDWNLFPG